MKKLMVRMQVHKVATDFQDTLRNFDPRDNIPDRCDWVQCKLMPSPGSDSCAVAEVTHCTNSVNCM